MSQPSLLDKYHLADAFEPAHLVDEQLHDDNRRYRKEDRVVFNGVDLEDDEPLLQQV